MTKQLANLTTVFNLETHVIEEVKTFQNYAQIFENTKEINAVAGHNVEDCLGTLATNIRLLQAAISDLEIHVRYLKRKGKQYGQTNSQNP